MVADAADKALDRRNSESVTNTVRRHTPACKRACGTEHPQHPLLHPLDEIRALASCLEGTPPAQASNEEANGLGHDSKHSMDHSYRVRIVLQPLAVTLRASSRTPLATPWKLTPARDPLDRPRYRTGRTRQFATNGEIRPIQTPSRMASVSCKGLQFSENFT